MANWFHETSIPRIFIGEISPIYIGHTAEASPTPTPPIILYILKVISSDSVGTPFSKNRNSGIMLPRAETKKRHPATTSVRLRPKLEARTPDNALPKIHPNSALDDVMPCRKWL